MVELTPEQEQRLREHIEKVKTPIGGKNGPPHLHLLDTTCSGKDRHDSNLTVKDVEVYPPGYREWCRTCLAQAPVDLGIESDVAPD